MVNKKANKKVIIALVCLAILGATGFFLYQHHQIRKLSQANVSPEKQVPGHNEVTQKETIQGTALDAKEKGKEDIDELEYQLDMAEEELDMVHKQLSDELARKDETTNSMMRGPLQDAYRMLDDPENRNKLRNKMKRGINMRYGALLKQLNLSPEKRTQINELLADQMIAMLEFDREINSISPTEENRNNFEQRREELKEQWDTKIEALLGTQDFQAYYDYKDSRRERNIVQAFAYTLYEDDKLTEEQQAYLINSMHQERKNMNSQLGNAEGMGAFLLGPDDEGRAEMSSEEFIKKREEMNDTISDGYIESAGSILSASQKEKFKEYLNRTEGGMLAPPLDMDVAAPQDNTDEDPESGQGGMIIELW